MFRGRARQTTAAALISQHQHAFFRDHTVTEKKWPGPIGTRAPGLYVHEIGPGPRYPLWTYATVGLWEAVHSPEGHGLEFVVSSPRQDDRIVELLTMTNYYHAGPDEQRLDVGHTVPIGEPWLDRSACEHLLVSLPYPYGPDLEWCRWPGGHARHLWLLPITEPERDLKATAGLEALEGRLESAKIDPTDTARASVA